ncbi:MAG: PadR family transcriptional regulator [Kurthia sp.]|nr:PadR family transcriptional regulator [Candidatus Kurthia equi]
MTIQIFILSSLMEERNYPYKLKKKINDLQLQDLTSAFTESKLYYHFESLRKQGFIEVQEVLHEENRPDKQVFAITEKGRSAFPKKIYKLLESSETIGEMVIGLANIKYVDREKVCTILENKLEHLQEKWQLLNNIDQGQFNDPQTLPIREFMQDYVNDRHQHAITYLTRLIQEIKDGKI